MCVHNCIEYNHIVFKIYFQLNIEILLKLRSKFSARDGKIFNTVFNSSRISNYND